MSFYQELKRRNVFRVGIAYVVVAWLLLQLTEVLKELLGLPDEIGRTVVLLLLVGFIPTVIFAWAFEMTPEGIKRDHEVDRDASVAPQTGRKLDRIIISVLALALVWFAWDKFGSRSTPESVTTAETPAATELEKSIAVLPFVNMSGNQDNEYFSDGLSEELLNVLAKVNGLKVAARTSSFKFKNADADIAEIGQALNVATVLEGSVRRSGNQARITAQLIKVDDGFHLWSETYDRQLDNIFEVQDEIAQAIVDALKLPLLGQNNAPVESDRSADFEAYDLYLLGQYNMKEFNEANLTAAVGYFERATTIDPEFAPAWAGLASAYALLQDYSNMDFNEALSKAESATAKALELAPNSVDALNAQGLLFNYRGTRSLSVPVYEKALSIDPNNTEALRGLSNVLTNVEAERKLALMQRALELDPLSSTLQKFMLQRLSTAGKLAEAEEFAITELAKDPDNAGIHEGLGEIYLARGMVLQSVRAFVKTWHSRPGDVYPAWRLVRLHLSVNDMDGAEYWAEQARLRGGDDSRWAKVAQSQVDLQNRHFEELRARNADLFLADAQLDTFSRAFLGRALYDMGQTDQAIVQLRKTMAQLNTGDEPFSSFVEERVAGRLIALLPDGEERNELIEKLVVFTVADEAQVPWNIIACESVATAAALQGDRDRSLQKLQDCVNIGYTREFWIRTHPAYARWENDPALESVLLQMRAKAKGIREQLIAERAAP